MRYDASQLPGAGNSWKVIWSGSPPDAILGAMQAQITAEREKRALIAKSEGQKQQEINIAEGAKAAVITSAMTMLDRTKTAQAKPA